MGGRLGDLHPVVLREAPFGRGRGGGTGNDAADVAHGLASRRAGKTGDVAGSRLPTLAKVKSAVRCHRFAVSHDCLTIVRKTEPSGL